MAATTIRINASPMDFHRIARIGFEKISASARMAASSMVVSFSSRKKMAMRVRQDKCRGKPCDRPCDVLDDWYCIKARNGGLFGGFGNPRGRVFVRRDQRCQSAVYGQPMGRWDYGPDEAAIRKGYVI